MRLARAGCVDFFFPPVPAVIGEQRPATVEQSSAGATFAQEVLRSMLVGNAQFDE